MRRNFPQKKLHEPVEIFAVNFQRCQKKHRKEYIFPIYDLQLILVLFEFLLRHLEIDIFERFI